MSIQGCASAMHVVDDVREAIAECDRQGLNAPDTLRQVKEVLDMIYDAADKGYW